MGDMVLFDGPLGQVLGGSDPDLVLVWCGGCLFGRCPLGAKQMSLKDEREYKLFSSKLTYDVEGTSVDLVHTG